MKKIYVASSWRNNLQPGCVQALREAGFDAYDFREPVPGGKGFGWSEIDPGWQGWTIPQFKEALEHPIARKGFAADFNAMQAADACLLVCPSGRSAHLEAGWMAGAGKPVVVLLNEGDEPELMYLLANATTGSITQAVALLQYLLRKK